MKLIVGLGNPGLKYRHTRHNLGFQIIDELTGEFKVKLTNKKYCKSAFGTGKMSVQEISFALAKPLTFMNNSGQAVKALMKHYKIDPKDLIIICDDLNLDLGKIRIRKNGSSGGHNGLNSIIEEIKTENFIRLRIGIGKPSLRQNPAVYVLNNFTKSEKYVIKEIIPLVCEVVKMMLAEGIETAMNKYNKKGPDNKL